MVQSGSVSEFSRSFFENTGESYDKVVHSFTLGLDYYWKRVIFSRIQNCNRALDLACGTGIVTLGLARKFPQAEIVGVDMSADYLSVYRRRLERRPEIRARAILGNAEDVELEGKFDVVVSSYIPKYVNPKRLLQNLRSHLTPGATLVLHDFTLPPNPFWRSIWNGYNSLMNWAGLKMFPEWHEVFDDNLTNLIKNSNWFEDFRTVLSQFDFTVEGKYITLGSSALIWATWKGN